MPGVLTETLTAYFDLSGSSTVFVLDDPVRGVLDQATYVLAGDVATDVTEGVRSITIDRGRERLLDEMMTGVASVEINNYDRGWDPTYAPGPYYGNIRPGKRITVNTNGYVRFDGLIDDLNYVQPIDGDSVVQFDAADGLASLGSAEFDEWTATAGDTPAERLTAICDRTEVQYPASRNFDDGGSGTTLQGDAVSWGSNVLNYAQLVAKCDLGQFFVTRDGVLTYFSKDHSYTAVGNPLFSDDLATDPTGIFYSAIELDYGTELLYNRVSVDPYGMTKQTVQDETSIDTFQKVWSLSLSAMPLEDETQAYALAQYILDLYSQPVTRIAAITVDVHALETADQGAVLALDIGDAIQVKYTPNSLGDAINQFVIIEGMSELIGAGGTFHSITFRLSKAADGFDGDLFILDSAVYGVLDSSAGVLAF
jgi:hypothetical protein